MGSDLPSLSQYKYSILKVMIYIIFLKLRDGTLVFVPWKLAAGHIEGLQVSGLHIDKPI